MQTPRARSDGGRWSCPMLGDGHGDVSVRRRRRRRLVAVGALVALAIASSLNEERAPSTARNGAGFGERGRAGTTDGASCWSDRPVPGRSRIRRTPTRRRRTKKPLPTFLHGGSSFVDIDDEEDGNDVLMTKSKLSSIDSIQKSLTIDTKKILSGDPKDPKNIIAAAALGDVNAIVTLAKRGANVNCKGQEGLNPLIQAVAFHRPQAVEALIDLGCDVNIRSEDGTTALLCAVMKRYDDIVQILLEAGADANIADTADGYFPLVAAVINKDASTVIKLVDSGADTNKQTSAGLTAAWFASFQGDLNLLRHVVTERTNLNIRSDDGLPALFAAAISKQKARRIPVASFLLEKGADINVPGAGDRNIVGICIETGDFELMRFMVERGADPSQPDKYGVTPLFLSSMNRDVSFLTYLLSRPLRGINHKNVDGHTALMSACMGMHSEHAKTLLQAGADPNIKTKKGSFALLMAASRGFKLIVEMLADTPETNLDEQDDNGITAIMAAAAEGYHEIVHTLLEMGADPTLRAKNMESALYYAAKNGHPKILAMLLGKQRICKIGPYEDTSPIMAAAGNGQVECLAMLLKKYPDYVNIADESGASAAYYAGQFGHVRCLKVLRKFGGDFAQKERLGFTPLHVAVEGNHTDAVKYLLDCGVDVDAAKTGCRITPLGIAAQHNNTNMMSILLKAGANVDALDGKETTALIKACGTGSLEAARMLLNHGADINRCDNTGLSPFQYSVAAKNLNLSQLLIDHGAEINRDNQRGWTPLFWSVFKEDFTASRFLLEHGINAKHRDIYRRTANDYSKMFYNKTLYELASVPTPEWEQVKDALDHSNHPLYLPEEDDKQRCSKTLDKDDSILEESIVDIPRAVLPETWNKTDSLKEEINAHMGKSVLEPSL